jgi:hypothetical protein
VGAVVLKAEGQVAGELVYGGSEVFVKEDGFDVGQICF